MSRSYKKSPYSTDYTRGRWTLRRHANKRVRKYKGELSNGKAYKNLYPSYSLRDWCNRYTWKEWLARAYYDAQKYDIYYNMNNKVFLVDEAKEFEKWNRYYRMK